jgi:squalene synthase HpnC/squalene synthase HpnD
MLRPNELALATKNVPAPGCSIDDAQKYTRWLATHHYENFNVVSWLLPKELHQHFYNVYAYCRWADDLGDEIPDGNRAVELLDWWERELNACYDDKPSHAVFIALRETVLAQDIPKEPFADLLKAFRQDQFVKRYENWDAVIDYCVYSANPVGRLVLYLCGYRDAERQRLSDATCTALQLANFWQDVSRDLEKGRIYIPLDIAASHEVAEADIVAKRFSAGYVTLMKEHTARTRVLFNDGLPLAKVVNTRLSIDLEMFSRGGLAVLDAIESSGYNTLQHRPSIGKAKQAGLLGRLLLTHAATKINRKSKAEIAAAQQRFVPPTLKRRPVAAAPPSKSSATAESSVPASYESCLQIAKASNSNFYYAFFLLPKSRRDGIVALYAFMRLIDDVADEGEDVAIKQKGLARWRAALDAAVTGSPLPPTATPQGAAEVLPALVDTMRRYNMPARYLHDLISGAEMDLTVTEYPTFDRLREYCYRVAGTVGLTCTHVFGYTDQRAVDLAEKLGLAFQLTNIIRDVHDDYALGRVYIPQEDLERYNVVHEDFSRREATLGVRELLRFQADRAWQNYKEGAELLGLISPESRGTLWLLTHTYSALLARIESLDFAVFGERVRLSRAEKMLFIAQARFGRVTEENILEKCDRDRRRSGGTRGRRRAS